MAERKTKNTKLPRNKKFFFYIFAFIINLMVFFLIGLVYVSYTNYANKSLFDENVKSVSNLNIVSASVTDTYTQNLHNHLDNITHYILEKKLSYPQTLDFLETINTNPDRQLQLIFSGTFRNTNEISFGDYSGVSIRKTIEDGVITTSVKKIIYNRGYYDILRSFTDINDSHDKKKCFVTEFTDPDTKQKSFAVYRHVTLTDEKNTKKLYTILLVVSSENALKACNLQNKYKGQSTVITDNNGTYIIKNNEFRNTNFFDYIINYNGLTLNWKTQLQKEVYEKSLIKDSTTNLFYKNHQGIDCLFSIDGLENDWYSITCVPLQSFNLKDNSINFSLFILLLFILLFVFDGIIVYLIGKDMAEKTKTAELAKISATEANLAKSRFLSTMSHELRTPLNAIIGFVSLSEGVMDNPLQLADYLNKITISSKLLLQLISDILDISAIESNKMKINYGEFNLRTLITSLSAIFYDQCSKKNIEFSVLLKNIHSENLVGDTIRVNQVLLNYLSNAVKFTPNSGNIQFKVEQTYQNDESIRIKFSIIDTGCGISEEQMNRLFKPFERATGEKAIKYRGTGLGLSISKNITELMNGTVGVESIDGSGSTFWAEIPFIISEKAKTQVYSPIRELNIITAINNREEREYFGQILANLGVSFTVVADVQSVFDTLKNNGQKDNPYNLCILDWKLPDFSAQDATVELRKTYKENELKIVILAYDLTSSRPVCSKDGATYIFCKPVFSSALYDFLQEVVTKKVKTIEPQKNKYDLKQKNILLVEDNAFNIEIAENMLQSFNAKVETAINGQEALDIFLASTPGYFDAILMDIQMPVMNGYEATRKIRGSSHADAKKIPILAMTADAFSEDIEKAKIAGMNEHIAKPIEIDHLYKILRSVLNLI